MKEDIKLLVEQARKGSEKAFEQLYNTYKKTIWWTAYKVVKNIDVADDITSMVFTKAFTKLDSYTQHISFEMWLKTITLNTAIDYIRRNKKENLNSYIDDEDNFIQLQELDRSPEENFINKQNIEVIKKCMLRLRKRYRDLIQMKLDGLTYQEIAKKLAMPESTVKGSLNKARQKLRELFNNY